MNKTYICEMNGATVLVVLILAITVSHFLNRSLDYNEKQLHCQPIIGIYHGQK